MNRVITTAAVGLLALAGGVATAQPLFEYSFTAAEGAQEGLPISIMPGIGAQQPWTAADVNGEGYAVTGNNWVRTEAETSYQLAVGESARVIVDLRLSNGQARMGFAEQTLHTGNNTPDPGVGTDISVAGTDVTVGKGPFSVTALDSAADLLRVTADFTRLATEGQYATTVTVSNVTDGTLVGITNYSATATTSPLPWGDGVNLQSSFRALDLAGGSMEVHYFSTEIVAATAPTVWNGNVSDVWDIGTTPNWTINGSSATYEDGVAVLFDDSATGSGTVDLQDANFIGLAPQSVTIANETKPYTFTSSFIGLVGSTPVIKEGAGTAVFASSLWNNQTGDTSVKAGQLTLTTGGQSPNSPHVVSSGATLSVRLEFVGGFYTIQSLECEADSTLEFDFGANTPGTFGALLILSDEAADSLTVNGAVSVNVVGGSGWTVGESYPLIQYTGNFSAFNDLELGELPAGVFGVLTHDVANKTISLTVTPESTIWNGNLSSVWDIGATANWITSQGASTTYSDGDVVRFDDNAVGDGTVEIPASVSPFSVTVDNISKDYVFNGPAAIVSGSLTKSGPGSLTLSVPQTYDGNTEIKGGTVILGASDVLPQANIKILGGTLDLNGHDQSATGLEMNNGTIRGGGKLVLNNKPTFNGENLITGGEIPIAGEGDFALNVDTGNTVIESTISGTNKVTTDWGNEGAAVFSGTNTFSGGLDVFDGTDIRVGSDEQALGTGSVLFRNASTITSDGETPRTIPNPITIGFGNNGRVAVGDADHAGAITFTGPITLDDGNGDTIISPFVPTTITGVISEGASKALGVNNGAAGGVNAPKLTLTAANSFTGGFRMYWGMGQVRIGNDQALGTGPIRFNNQSGVSSDGPTPRTIANDVHFGDGNGAMHLGNEVDNGTLTFTGSVVIEGDGGDGNNPVQFNCYSDVVFDGPFGEIDTPNRNLQKLGPGTMTINTAGIGTTYGGYTTISEGTLLVNGALNGSVVTVNGGTLGGTGVVTPNVTVNEGGSLAAGTSIGTLILGGDLDLAGGTVIVEVDTSATPANDVVDVAGTVVNTASSAIEVVNLGPELAVGTKFYPFGEGQTVANGSAMTVTGGGAFWQNNLEVDGSIEVATFVPPMLNWQLVGADPTVIEFSWDGAFKLMYQTNSLDVGLSDNWMDWPDTSNPVQVTNDPAIPATFFSLGQ